VLSVPDRVLGAVLREGVKGSTRLAGRAETGVESWVGPLPLSITQKPETPLAPDTSRGVTARTALSKEESEAQTVSIKINPSGSVVLPSQQRMSFAAIPIDSDGVALQGLSVEWESSDTQIVFVGKDGQAVAGRTGTAVITARAGKTTASTSVTVVEATKENYGGKKNVDSSRQTKTGLVKFADKDRAVAQKFRTKSQSSVSGGLSKRATFAHAVVAPRMLLLRPPSEDPLPDDETSSLYQPANNVGMPPGTTRPGGASPAVATEGTETGNKDFTFGLPMVNLPGRGINVSLGLIYNSLLYNKSTDPGNSSTWLTYDVDSGYPAPGFRVGYGQIEDQGTYGFTLTDADGTRHALVATSAGNYDTTDGTFIHFQLGLVNTLSYPDGTRVLYSAAGGGYRSYPTKITDRNGNYLTISYVGGIGPRISSIQDTLGRYVRFYYAANGDLVTITAPALTGQNPTERQVMRFYYEDVTLNASSLFSSSVNVSMPTTSHVIRYVFLPSSVETNNAHIGYRFDYSAYGMIYQTVQFRGMTVNSTSSTSTGSISSEGTQAAISTYNYPGTPVNSTSGLSDVPTYTTRTDDWAGRTTGMNGNPATAPYYTFSVDESAGVSTVTAPDGAITETRATVHNGYWDNGLIKESFLDRQGSTSLVHNVTDWEQGAGGSPRVSQVRTTNEAGQTKATVLSYTGSYNNIAIVSERDFTIDGSVSATVLRRTETTYVESSSYTSRNLIHLPATVKVFPGVSTSPISRVDYAYDDYGSSHANLTSRDDIVMHDPAFDPFHAPVQTCEWQCSTYGYIDGVYQCLDPQWVCGLTTPYDSATDYRGNVTGVTTYSDAAASSGAVTHSTTYDIAGNAITAQVDCCQLKTFSYTDSPNTHTYAYPTSVVRGNPNGLHLTSSATYDFNTGLVATATDENGQTSTRYYFIDSLRLEHVISPGGGTAYLTYSDALEPDANGRYHYFAQTQTKLDAPPSGPARYITNRRYFDGRDAVSRILNNYTATDGYSTQDIEYDVMGRAYRASNPYFASGYSSAINPGGFWTSRAFDHMGRVTAITMPRGDDNNTLTTSVASSYEGVFTTVTDQAGKARRQKMDALGRMVRLDEPDASGNLGSTGAPNQATFYDFDALDNLVHISQPGPSSITQHRYFKFDSQSRLVRERQVEQATNASYNLSDPLTGNSAWSRRIDYNSSGLVTDGYDARGVHTQFYYDSLNRPTQISYSDGTPTAHYYYDSQTLPGGHPNYTPVNSNGRLIAMTYGSGPTGTYFNYDEVGRTASQWQVTGSTPTTYSLSYSYNLAGLLTSQSYPSGRALTYAYDEGGRLASAGDGTTTFANSLSYVAYGGLKSETWGNGAVHSLNYNQRLQPSEVKLKQSATGVELQRFNYAYGQVTPSTGSIDTSKNNGQIGRIDGFVNGAATKEWDQRFVYDELGRLSTASEYKQGNNSLLTWSQQYTFDRWGNRLQSGGGNTGVSYTQILSSEVDAASNRFIATGSTPTSYDAAGNVTTDTKFRGMNYSYDANGRQSFAELTNHTNQQTSVYDCAGQRVQTTAGGVTRSMVYDIFGQLVADYNGVSLQRENIYRGGQLLGVIETPTAAAPSGLTATPGSGGASITLGWSAASGATNYRVERRAAGTAFEKVGTTASNSFTDSLTGSGSAYLYKVCAADGLGNCVSAYSNVALGATVTFPTDPTIISIADDPTGVSVTTVKAAHIAELRSAVNAVRGLAGWGAASWTYPAATGDTIHKEDVRDLREKLDEALVALAIQISSYTDSPLAGAPNGTLIKKAHITELRDRAKSGTGTSGSGGSSGGVRYVLSDVQGSSRVVMNHGTYGSSTVIARHDYLPFGSEISSGTGLRTGTQGYGASDANRQKYGLTERDDTTGLDHAWWRKYENAAGRWTSPDPMAGSIADPQSFNRYAYVTNDPVNFIDPSGLSEEVIKTYTWDWKPWSNPLYWRFLFWTPDIGGESTTTGGGDPGDCSGHRTRLLGQNKNALIDAWNRSQVGTVMAHEEGGLLGTLIDEGQPWQKDQQIDERFDPTRGSTGKLKGFTPWGQKKIARDSGVVAYRYWYHTHPFEAGDQDPLDPNIYYVGPNHPSMNDKSVSSPYPEGLGLMGVIVSSTNIIVFDGSGIILCNFKR
jgi:RHS repeat-associated protein